MKFRPCIDLHAGKVKQIVGSSLSDNAPERLQTNFEADKPAEWFARLYRQYRLNGGHVIRLGPGNSAAALAALSAWPGGLQLGGGISPDNAVKWIEAGAAALIVTSWVFYDGKLDLARLRALQQKIGKDRLVLDVSCRRQGDDYLIVTDRWQRFTTEKIQPRLLDMLSRYCSEFLIHAVDVEGHARGIETGLLRRLGKWAPLPTTYAGGIHTLEDISRIEALGGGRIDFTVGSALDIFGGQQLTFEALARRYGPSFPEDKESESCRNLMS